MLVRLLIVLTVVGVSLALAYVWRSREGKFTEAHGRFDRAELGLKAKRPSAVLVEFFGEHCPPCVTVERRLAIVAADVPDTEIVRIDAGANMDLAERYGVKRVPTLFVTDGSLKIIWRASGVPAEDAIRSALLGPDWAGRPHPSQAEVPR